MQDLRFADHVFARIHAEAGGRYDDRAYFFVLASIEYLQLKLDKRRHVSGAELAWGCRDLARERFGMLARSVLESWGVTTTGDFGRIVFALVTVELLSAQPTDHEADFANVYDFATAFNVEYQIDGRLKTPRES